MPITDPEAIAFLSNEVRPIAERLRDLNVVVDDILLSWFAGLNVTITDTADVIEDGRDAEGVSRVTGADVHALMAQVLAIQAQFDTANVMDVIDKPTVRPIQVSS